MESKTKKLTAIAMLVAMAFIMVSCVRIPVVLFLKYEPKDVVITLGGFLFGPLTALTVSVIVSVIELFTISENGILGLIMNIMSSCSFACTAAWIYKKKRSLSGAVLGLCVGTALMVAVMLLWNYLITPIYMGFPREAVAALLIPAFLPFNLIKGGFNSAFTFLLYKPITTALRKAGFIPPSDTGHISKKPIGLWILSGVVIVTCVLLTLTLNGML